VKIYQVDAFADRPFAGNPAGVCLLESERPEAWMQSVAAEMNLSETAFARRIDSGFSLRWFTPTCEVELCGHATLATAHILWEAGVLPPAQSAEFHTMSGLLTARRAGDLIELDFPARAVEPAPAPAAVLEALAAGRAPLRPLFSGTDGTLDFLELATEEQVAGLAPDFRLLSRAGTGTALVTARGGAHDFVSRFFAPAVGIDEDPVTGVAHCYLAPYWSARLAKRELVGWQASARGGKVICRPEGDRVVLGGRAVTVLEARLLA
jgi:PhzF family phenazine biosynthesis protein